MAKSKYSPALFEVMNRQKDAGKLGVPKWWKGGSSGPQSDGTQATNEPDAVPDGPTSADSAVQPIERPVSTSSRALPTQAAAAVASEDLHPEPATSPSRSERIAASAGRFPGVRFEAGQIHLALSPTHAAAVCGAVLIAMLASYQVGRGLSGGTAPEDRSGGLALLGETPNPGVLDQPAAHADVMPKRTSPSVAVPPSPGDRPSATPPVSAATTADLTVGLHYVLLDKYPRDAFKTAEFVQNWLAEKHAIATVLCERKDSYWLIGKTGFDFSIDGQSDQCDQYVERIKTLGKDCRRELIRADLPVYGFASPMKFKLQE